MNRYSPGHSVLDASGYLMPLFPMMVMVVFDRQQFYVPNLMEVALLWVVGLLISYGLIAVHECGHAVVARINGVGILNITIGHWRRLFTWSIGGASVVVRATPSSGYVTFRPTGDLLSLRKMSLTLLAGVVTEAIVVCWVASTPAPTYVLSSSDLVLCYARLAVLCIGGWHVFFNLWPGRGKVGGALHPTDGLQLLNLWRTRNRLDGQRQLLAHELEIQRLIKIKEFGKAIELTEALGAKLPDNSKVKLLLAKVCMLADESIRAEAILRELLNEPIGLEMTAEVLDVLCCLVLYNGRTDLLQEADAWSKEATVIAPGAITLDGTRGSILIELGCLEEGIATLRRVGKRTECDVDRMISSAYLAKAYAAQGDVRMAAECLAQARKLDPTHPLMSRISAELGELQLPDSKIGSPTSSPN